MGEGRTKTVISVLSHEGYDTNSLVLIHGLLADVQKTQDMPALPSLLAC